MDNPDKTKYYIHDAIKSVLSSCKTPTDLWFALKKFGIELEYKHKRTSNEIEGVSFRYNNISFKGSQIDRKFSFGNLQKEFDRNILEARKQGQDELLQEQAKQRAKQEAEQNARKETEAKPKIPLIKGVELTPEQWQILKEGGFIYLENMQKKDGEKLSAYLFFDDQMKQHFVTRQNPETFVKYGKYEMRLMDKIRIEAGFVTKAKVKWWGGIDFQYPYLWKANKTNTEYQESWGDPRVPKIQKVEQKPKQPAIQKKNRGRKR